MSTTTAAPAWTTAASVVFFTVDDYGEEHSPREEHISRWSLDDLRAHCEACGEEAVVLDARRRTVIRVTNDGRVLS